MTTLLLRQHSSAEQLQRRTTLLKSREARRAVAIALEPQLALAAAAAVGAAAAGVNAAGSAIKNQAKNRKCWYYDR
jgi:hypothetical protein